MNIAGREIGPGEPVYIVAEVGGNHGGNIAVAEQILLAAQAAGADAVKMQTYVPEDFAKPGDGRYALYERAAMPLYMQTQLAVRAKSCGMTLFSTPGREWAVDWLEENIDPPAYKISSTSCTNLSLIRRCRDTGKPLIISTGACESDEIIKTICAVQDVESDVAMLVCTASYPCYPAEVNLGRVRMFLRTVGFSDHSPRYLGSVAAVAAVAIGATIIEKHVMLDTETAIDAEVSLDMEEFADYVRDIRAAEQMLGSEFGPLPCEEPVLWLKEMLRSD